MASPAGSHEDLKLEHSRSGEVSNSSSNKKKFSTYIGPKIFFYYKTKMAARHVNLVCRSFNFKNYFTIDRIGMRGGLALFWSSAVEVNIISYNSYHIDTVVHNESGLVWRCTGSMSI